MTNASGTRSTFRPEMGFGDYLRKARREYTSYGQKEMAAALGVTTQAYSAWEAGRNTPRDLRAIAEKLERITNIDRSWFLGWQAPESRPSDYKSQVPPKARPTNRRDRTRGPSNRAR